MINTTYLLSAELDRSLDGLRVPVPIGVIIPERDPQVQLPVRVLTQV